MNKKGAGVDLIVWAIVSLFLVIFIIGTLYTFNLIEDKLSSIPSPSPDIVNFSEITSQTFGHVNNGLQNLSWIGVSIIIMQLVSILVANAFVRTYPIAFLIYLGYIILSLIFAVYIRNAYETMFFINENALTDTAISLGAMSYIILNLHIIVVVTGFIGLIILIVNVSISQQEGVIQQ